MPPITYLAMSSSKNNSFDARLRLVQHAKKHGIRDAMRAFNCARNTVRLWTRRYEQEGRKGLVNRSRAPRSCPHKTTPYQEKRVLDAREKVPCFGPQRLQDHFDLKCSLGAIARILKQHGKTRKRRKKTQKKNDLRAVKMRYRAFERLQADTKALYDIAAYWPQMQANGLPKHQYTHLDVKSGALFIDYADELSATYSRMASERVIEHLRKHDGVDPSGITLSTDNGSEYGGAERTTRQHGYHTQIEDLGVTHRFFPPRTPNAHANVESSHHFVEVELFDLERFRSRRDFFEKVATYQLWWNFARRNYSKGKRTPAQILEEEGVDPRILLLTPTDLDLMLRNQPMPHQVGQHLPVDTGLW